MSIASYSYRIFPYMITNAKAFYSLLSDIFVVYMLNIRLIKTFKILILNGSSLQITKDMVYIQKTYVGFNLMILP